MRYYAAWLGRWTSADPIGLGDGVNRYAYVSNRPTALTDSGGTKADPPPKESQEDFQARRMQELIESGQSRDDALSTLGDELSERYPSKKKPGLVREYYRPAARHQEMRERDKAAIQEWYDRRIASISAAENAVRHAGDKFDGLLEAVAGFTPAGVALDLRDLKDAIAAGSGLGVGIAVAGFLPFGDLLKGGKRLTGLGEEALGAGGDVSRRLTIRRRPAVSRMPRPPRLAWVTGSMPQRGEQKISEGLILRTG